MKNTSESTSENTSENTENKWCLNDIYPSFTAAEFLTDFEKVAPAIQELNQLAAHLSSFEDVVVLLKKLDAHTCITDRLGSYASLVFATDTANEEAIKYEYLLETLLAETSKMDVLLAGFLAKLAETEDIAALAKAHGVEDYTYFLTTQANSHQHLMSEKEEILAAALAPTGSSAWSMLQDTLIATLTCDYTDPTTGEIRPIGIGECRNLAYDPSPAVRKAAYEAELAAYPKVTTPVAAALNSVKGEVNLLSNLRHYESPLAESLFEAGMTKATLDAMFTAIDENVALFRDYLKLKAKYLNKVQGTHYTGLPFYELFAPVGATGEDAAMTYPQAQQFVADNLGKFSPSMQAVAQEAYDKHWIDVTPRDGKVSGASCADIHQVKQFRLLLNHGDSISDAITLAHELGHGYHAVQLFKGNILNSYQVPMPLAETASTFCEMIVKNAALADESLSDGTKLQILEGNLQDATQVMIDIYSRYLFETAVFDTRKDHPLSVEELNSLMLDAQKKTYGDGLDPELMHPYMWVVKPHYYSAGLSFYNFPYAFGALLAIGLYKIYQQSPDTFQSKYDSFLLATGQMPVKEACAMLGVDVESPDFWRSALDVIQADMEKFKALVG